MTKPFPSEDGVTQPFPSEDGVTKPFPSEDGVTQPFPSEDGVTKPFPSEDGVTVAEEPQRGYLRRLLRPWKLVSFALGTAFFIWGADAFDAPTWDVPVSVLMSVATFLLAPWSIDQALIGLRHRGGRQRLRLLVGAAGIYCCGSGSYEIYHLIHSGWHPPTYWENLFFSVPTAIVAGMLWRLDLSLRELWAATRNTDKR